ncbi:MAG: flagellar basal body P-ring formation protein FlgA [Candidatus Rokubacteria bacterium]|nr:flagellar basal body P-ring formation protein FlgA [Candidatus Rokubacteria bacterium]
MFIRRLALVLLAGLLIALATLVSVSVASNLSPGTWLASETLTRIAREWVVERLAADIDTAALEVTGTPREIALPAGDVTVNVTLQSGSVAAGALTVLVEATVAEGQGRRTTRSATVGFRVNALQDVVVAVRELSRRTVITSGDVRVERRAASRTAPGAVHDVREAVGKEVTRPIAPGEPVTTGSLTAPVLIRRGSTVSLLLEGPAFRILARGIASEDGVLGQPIRVMNQASRKEVVGRVEDERTVRIAY